MKKLICSFALILSCIGFASAQKVSAESGYYPMGYSGDAWVGEVTSADENTREITLTYRKGDKVKTFTGVLPSGYTAKMKDGKEQSFPVTDLIGMNIKVYYMEKEKKSEGKKVKFNDIFNVKFLPAKK